MTQESLKVQFPHLQALSLAPVPIPGHLVIPEYEIRTTTSFYRVLQRWRTFIHRISRLGRRIGASVSPGATECSVRSGGQVHIRMQEPRRYAPNVHFPRLLRLSCNLISVKRGLAMNTDSRENTDIEYREITEYRKQS